MTSGSQGEEGPARLSVAGDVAVGPLRLLRPKLLGRLNRARQGHRTLGKGVFLGFAVLFFWGLIFLAVYRMLLYFRSAQGIGDLLAGKLLGMALLTFLMILLLSNVITALSTFFLSRDLELIASSPADPLHVYWARLTESAVNSSWMVLLMAVPLITAYGVIFSAGAAYYLLAVGTIIPLLVIPAVTGAAVTLCLVNVFPARRTRDLLALVAIFAAAGVVVLIRLIRPRRLIRPEEAQSLVDFMAGLRTPTSPWLPSEWAANTLLSWLNGRFDPFLFLLLLATAAAFLVVGGWLHTRFFHAGFSRAQEGAERQEGRVRERRWEWALSGFSLTTRELAKKEVRVFLRDTTQWSQLILLGVLVVVYVYNIQALRVASDTEISFFLVNLIGFLNLGLAGFVVAAIAARFVFPAMSLEGRMTWLLRSSPLLPEKLFWVKYWVGTLPLLAVALPLILVTNLLLGVAPLLMAVSTLTMVGVTMAFTAMALAFGALYPNFETENPAEIPTSFGGLLFMMSAVAYLAAVIILEGWPMYHYLLARFRGSPQDPIDLFPLVAGIAGATLLTVGILLLSLRTGVERMGEAEVFTGEGAA